MKVGRNDPCHCGSGQKYKKCHLASDDAARSVELAQAYEARVAQKAREAEAAATQPAGENATEPGAEHDGARDAAARPTKAEPAHRPAAPGGPAQPRTKQLSSAPTGARRKAI
jgi:hypothetical protein